MFRFVYTCRSMAKGNKHLCINKQNYFMLKKILQKHLNLMHIKVTTRAKEWSLGAKKSLVSGANFSRTFFFFDKGNFVSISQWLCIGGFGDNALDTRSFLGSGDLLRDFYCIFSDCMLKKEDEGASSRQRESKAREMRSADCNDPAPEYQKRVKWGYVRKVGQSVWRNRVHPDPNLIAGSG